MNRPAHDVRIVRAGVSDASTVRELARQLDAHEGRMAMPGTTVRRWEELLSGDDVVVLVASDGVGTLGYVSAVRTVHLASGCDVMELGGLFVVPRARDAGIGTELMRALGTHCAPRAVRWEVDEGDLRAQRYSMRLGARQRRRVIAWWQPAAAGDGDEGG